MCLVGTFIRKKASFKGYAFYLCGHRQDAEDMMQDAFLKIIRADQRGQKFSCVEQEAAYISAAIKSVNMDRIRDMYYSRNSKSGVKEAEVKDRQLFEHILDTNGKVEHEGERDLNFEHERITQEFKMELCLELLTLYHPHIRDTFIQRGKGVPFKKIAKKTGRSINTVLGEFRYAQLFLRDKINEIKQSTDRPIFEPI